MNIAKPEHGLTIVWILEMNFDLPKVQNGK